MVLCSFGVEAFDCLGGRREVDGQSFTCVYIYIFTYTSSIYLCICYIYTYNDIGMT